MSLIDKKFELLCRSGQVPSLRKLWIPGNIGTRAARAAHLQQRIEPLSTGPMTLKALLKWSVALSFVSKQSTSGVV